MGGRERGISEELKTVWVKLCRYAVCGDIFYIVRIDIVRLQAREYFFSFYLRMILLSCLGFTNSVLYKATQHNIS